MKPDFYTFPAAFSVICGLMTGCAAPPLEPAERRILYPLFMNRTIEETQLYRTRAELRPDLISIEDIGPVLASYLAPAGDALILLPHRLDKSKLDFSPDSLKEVDRWLADIHTINELQAGQGKAGELITMDERGEHTVIFAGLYLGEVIRANAEPEWNWVRFDQFLAKNPAFTEYYGDQAEFDIFVLLGPQGVTSPINTALKRMVHGKENSLHFIGQLLMQDVDLKKALNGHNLMGLDRPDPAS